MIKWILGALVVIVLALAGTCYFGYQKLTGGGDSVTIAMAASVEEVFAQIATPDSMANWMISEKIEGPFGRGLLAAGDTLQFGNTTDVSITTKDSNGVSTSHRSTWIVREVNAPMLLVTEMRTDSAGQSRVMLVRRDSVVAAGDSTILISSFSSPLFDSLSTAVADSSKVGGSILGASNKMMIGVIRMSAAADLKNLKARLEGTTPK